MTEEKTIKDPHGLLSSGEALADEKALAPLFHVSRRELRLLLSGPLYREVRHLRPAEGPTLYCIADVRAGVERLRPRLEERRRRAEELETTQRAERAARLLARASAPKSSPKPAAARLLAQKTPTGSKADTPRGRAEPEVFVSRRGPRP